MTRTFLSVVCSIIVLVGCASAPPDPNAPQKVKRVTEFCEPGQSGSVIDSAGNRPSPRVAQGTGFMNPSDVSATATPRHKECTDPPKEKPKPKPATN